MHSLQRYPECSIIRGEAIQNSSESCPGKHDRSLAFNRRTCWHFHANKQLLHTDAALHTQSVSTGGSFVVKVLDDAIRNGAVQICNFSFSDRDRDQATIPARLILRILFAFERDKWLVRRGWVLLWRRGSVHGTTPSLDARTYPVPKILNSLILYTSIPVREKNHTSAKVQTTPTTFVSTSLFRLLAASAHWCC